MSNNLVPATREDILSLTTVVKGLAESTDQKFDKIDQKIDRLAKSTNQKIDDLAAITNRFATHVEGRFNKVESRLDGLEIGQVAMVQQLDNLEDGQVAMVQRLDSLDAGQGRLERKLDASIDQLDRHSLDITALKQKTGIK